MQSLEVMENLGVVFIVFVFEGGFVERGGSRLEVGYDYRHYK